MELLIGLFVAFMVGLILGLLAMWWWKRGDYARGLWHGEQEVLEMMSKEEYLARQCRQKGE